MIETTVNKMLTTIENLKQAIKDDIEDIKLANHEKLLERNEQKQAYMDDIVELKNELNQALVHAVKSGVDVNIYRNIVNHLEDELKELYALNGKLASIVLPVKQMYKEIVDELTERSGGNIFEIKA
jgi:DNA repair exonuclease SbcCD ATPase subunit